MSRRMILTALGYGTFIVLPFLYMLMTIHNLLTTEANSITRIAAVQAQVEQG